MKREVARILRDELKDPRLGFVTVTGVELTKDMRYAKILVSIYGTEEEHQKSLQALKSATGFVRHELGKAIKLRFNPEITFEFDSSIERGARIAEILTKVHRENEDSNP